MRPPVIRASFLRDGEIAVDNFAGGGGASTGVARAIGRSPDIAINHDAAAIAMHAANHPTTEHYQESVWKVDPVKACAGRPVGLAWFSPDCTHHSKAKGGKPRKKKIRGLAWVVIRWARAVRPRCIFLENVEEFADWGPLTKDGHPREDAKGKTFRAFVAKLRRYGYVVEWRTLVACDYGAPTSRKRLFLVARCDGLPIAWPQPTHGRGRAKPWRAAAEIIDWTLPCRSIFDRHKPLADATLRRIAAGVQRYVINSAQPFIVPLTHRGGDRVHGLDEPLRTVTAAHRGELALVSPTLIQTGYGERKGQAPRILNLAKPLGTVVASGKHAVVAAFLTKHYGGVVGHGVERPIGTITTQDHHSLSLAFMTKFYGTATGSDMRAPVPTVTATGQHLAEVRAFLVKYNRTATDGQQLGLPLHTITTKARFGLVMVHGEPYQIADIGMRMLAPRELFAAQGFPPDYVIAPELDGKPLTKTEQIAKCGNSVPPDVVTALVTANAHRRATEAA